MGNAAGSLAGPSRTVAAVIILICLSSAPYMSITRWATDAGLWTTAWPYVFTYWGPALIGASLFVIDVVAPWGAHSAADRRRMAVALSVPVALVTWSVSSALWSTSPTTTPTQALLFSLIVATTAWFGLSLTFRAQLTALFVAAQLLTLGSLATVVMVESARSSPYLGDRSWIGLFGNPNSLGPVAAFALICTIGVAVPAGRRWWPLLGVVAAADVIVAGGATSVTSWLALAAGTITMATVIVVTAGPSDRRRRRTIGAAAVLLAAVTVAAVLVSSGVLSQLVRKDATLSGRTVVWGYVVDAVESRWIIGFGYAAFWDSPDNQRDYMETSGLDWVASSHSTFVDALVFLGSVGLVLVVALVVTSVGRMWWLALRLPDRQRAWWSGVGAFALVENLAESMMYAHSIFWMLLLVPGFAAVRWGPAGVRARDRQDASVAPQPSGAPHSDPTPWLAT